MPSSFWLIPPPYALLLLPCCVPLPLLDELHIILEYEEGVEIGSRKATRANRFIVSSTQYTGVMAGLEDFAAKLPEFRPDLVSFSGTCSLHLQRPGSAPIVAPFMAPPSAQAFICWIMWMAIAARNGCKKWRSSLAVCAPTTPVSPFTWNWPLWAPMPSSSKSLTCCCRRWIPLVSAAVWLCLGSANLSCAIACGYCRFE